jgi:hypothetical protein
LISAFFIYLFVYCGWKSNYRETSWKLILNTTNPTKTWWWTHVLRKGKQFLFANATSRVTLVTNHMPWSYPDFDLTTVSINSYLKFHYKLNLATSYCYVHRYYLHRIINYCILSNSPPSVFLFYNSTRVNLQSVDSINRWYESFSIRACILRCASLK